MLAPRHRSGGAIPDVAEHEDQLDRSLLVVRRDVVDGVAKRLVALRDGRLVWQGKPAEFDRDTFRQIYGEDAEPASNSEFVDA